LRILYMTQWFEPEPAFKGIGFAKALKERGHDIRVVTGFPNYPRGKVYPGYRIRPFRREQRDGIVVDRLLLFPSHSRSAAGRVLNYVSFGLSLFAYGIFAAGRADVVYAYHPPLTVALAAAAVGAIRRRPVVVDIQDLWPDTLASTGMMGGKGASRFLGALCNWVYRRAAGLIVSGPGMKRVLVERGVPDGKIEVVLNWADESQVAPKGQLDLAPFALAGRFTVIFAGNLGVAQGLDVVLDAARTVAGRDPRVQFLLVGDGVEADRLRARVAAEGLANVRLTGPVPRENVADLLHAADALLVTLVEDPLFEITIPSKTQFYLAVGKPVLMAMRGDAARLVEEAGGGVCVPPADPAALAEAVIALAGTDGGTLAAMGRRGRAAYAAGMSMASGIGKTVAILDRVASIGSRRGRNQRQDEH
jgi:glycosyltransferase involved in cell wall biosynthesis